MVVRIVAGVHADDRRRRRAVREHANEDKIGIMNPVKLVVEFGLEAAGFQQVNTSTGHREVRHQLVGHIFCRVNIGNGGFRGRGISSNFYFVTGGSPVCALKEIQMLAIELRLRG